jgi:hypothetical protein
VLYAPGALKQTWLKVKKRTFEIMLGWNSTLGEVTSQYRLQVFYRARGKEGVRSSLPLKVVG